MKDDRAHAQTLLRDLALVNARTARDLGPLPAGGLPVEPKRKPILPKPALSTESLPAIATDTSHSNEETDMDWTRIAAAATLTAAASLSACAADQGAHTSAAAPTQAQAEARVMVKPSPADSSAAETQTAEPEYGPPIPAAELRKRILALVESFQSLDDLERKNIEHALKVRLTRMQGMSEGYEYDGHTSEGWQYGISTAKLGRLDEPSTIIIGMDYGFDYDNDRPPIYCTLEFEPLAKELVAMGYERDKRAYNQGGDMTWGFGRDSKIDDAGFGISVSIYDLEIMDGTKQVCIKGFNIGGGRLNG